LRGADRVARFDDVALAEPHNNLLSLASDALDLGYRVQLHAFISDKRPASEITKLFERGAELWCHGIHHERGRPTTIAEVLASASALKGTTGRPVVGVSYPFDGAGPTAATLQRRGLRLSTLGLDSRTHIEACVDICSWPGPRLRSELAVAIALFKHQMHGLCLHADRLPVVPQNAMLRLFAPAVFNSNADASAMPLAT
jgi:peptidoglycan/xylan/chitin deacetylase (PgdA/CDA1 family)